MCERYELKASAGELARHCRFLDLAPPALLARGEMIPQAPILMLAAQDGGCVERRSRWGLVGRFLAAVPPSPPLTLCGEGLVARPFYSKILQRGRCLIPATAFVETQVLRGGGRRQVRFSHARGKPLLFAGVYDEHPLAGLTCAIVTTAADAMVSEVHARMPLMLDSAACAVWLAEHAPFPDDWFDTLMAGGASPPLRAEPLVEPVVSPQLAFAFA